MAIIIFGITIVYLIAGIVYFGSKLKNYSHLKHTISELGETGSIYEKQVGFGFFLVVGMLLFIISILARENFTAFVIAMSQALGYGLSAFFPCDRGSPLFGTWKQWVHNFAGVIGYGGSIFAILNASDDALPAQFIPFKTAGYLITFCILLACIPPNPVRGLAQRTGETLLFGCLLLLLL